MWQSPYEDTVIESVELISYTEFRGKDAEWRETTCPVPYIWSMTGEKAVPETGWEEKTTVGMIGDRFGWKGPANRAMKAAQAAGNIRFVMGSFKVKDDGELEFLNNCGCTVDADGNFEARAWLLDKEKFTDGGDFVFRIMDSNWSHVYAETRFHREKVVTNRKIIAQANETFKTLAGKKVKITLTADGKNVPADTRTPFATHWNEGGKTVWKQPFWRDMLPAGDFQNAKITNTILIEIPADATDIAFNLSDLAAPASVIYTDIHFEILP